MNSPELSVGNLRIRLLSAGTLRLDGGAMFGVVPKTMWGKVYPSDEENRITLGMNTPLIEGPWGTMLIDTGALGVQSEKLKKIYQIKNRDPLEGTGLSPGDINHVLLTHLHFDHTGGSTRKEGEKWVPRYYNATYWIGAEEWARACQPNEREKGSYFPETFRPLEAAGLVSFIEGKVEVLPGVVSVPAPGHTPGHRVVQFQCESAQAWFLADLVPTTRHLPLPWIMAYDHEPLVTLESRKRIFPLFVDRPIPLLFEHDKDPTIGFAVTTPKGIAFSPSLH
ncbi:MBL fold metallo-hydrolase [bacterium]|nr:MBL fold metallo-hydrolase [bacterium]